MEANEREFASIVRQHKNTIYTVCYMFSKDEDEVSDLFQEILINLWKGYEKFRGDSSLNSWIYKVSLNTCISADRKKKKMNAEKSFGAFCVNESWGAHIRNMRRVFMPQKR